MENRRDLQRHLIKFFLVTSRHEYISNLPTFFNRHKLEDFVGNFWNRFIICDIKTEEKYITLATIYAPNDDEPAFFQNFFEHLLDCRCDDLIIGGDFNLVLDLNKDKKGGRSKTHSNSVKTLQSFITELSLVDAWRVLNPDISRYTWRRKNPEIQCRLDFFPSEPKHDV